MAKFASLPSWCRLATCAILLLTASASGQPLDKRLFEDARDGRLDKFDFFAAALIAGGVVDEGELSGWLDRYMQHRQELLGLVMQQPTPERLQAIHAELHKRILTGAYRTSASDLRLTLSRGDFNCLSALVIYFDVCQAAGLEVKIWLERGHVWLRFAGETGACIAIEPGLAKWTVRSGLPRSLGRQITPVELLGKLYYNRGVELLESGRFAEGLQLLQISLALDPADGDARANVAAGLNNWAVECFKANRFGESAALIERGLALDPSFAPLVANKQLVRERLAQ
jgi:tetratricopeptide (TPR) repeat protein